MNNQDILKAFISKCKENLLTNKKMIALLNKKGIKESFVFESLNLGFVDDNVYKSIGNDPKILDILETTGLYKKSKPVFDKKITIPIYDEGKTIVNIAFLDLPPQGKCSFKLLNDKGILNYNYLKNTDKILFTKTPIDALLLIQGGYHNTTFIFGNDQKYIDFLINNNIRNSIFTFEGKATLNYKLESSKITVDKNIIDFDSLLGSANSKEYLDKVFNISNEIENKSSDSVTKIEKGFIFTFSHITYRIIGNFYEHSMSLKVNIKAIKDDEVFINSIDLYKNRERQNFIFNLMDKFNLRDHTLLENDLGKIIDVIEKHKEKNESEDEEIIISDKEKEEALSFLKKPNLLNEIENDISNLGYVRERRNKILTYLIMTSRLMDNPLHAIILSRSSAGKSQLIDIVESLCPREDLKSISDLSAQALYYVKENELKNKFIVIGEKEGSKESEYPLRELMSKKSISKAVTVKDQVSGFLKTVTIKVNGPIALVETTTSSKINPENLNRCFIVSVDESEDQTKAIHKSQRLNDTLEGHLLKNRMNKTFEKHHNAQMLLMNIKVFNPFAPLLTFPSQSIQTRRDNHKFLKLIKVICFLHQYQRPIKEQKLENNETLEYIECTIDDYKIAYELLIDGILDNSLDDLPKPARELFDIIKKYLSESPATQSQDMSDLTSINNTIFTRKEIRDYSKWSFAQIRNNFQILKEQEYLQLIPSKNGLAHSYKLFADYSDSVNNNSILSPEELEKKLSSNTNPNILNIPAYSGV